MMQYRARRGRAGSAGYLHRRWWLAIGLLALAAAGQTQESSMLRADAPQRYTVQEGDTLWSIAGMFLNDPWRWPDVWNKNESVDNPERIYPGDVVVLSIQDGQPKLRTLRMNTVKLQARVRVEPLRRPVATIEPSAIQPYLSAPLITGSKELDAAGYVVASASEGLLLGRYDQFYARGISGRPSDMFRIFRPGKVYVDPLSGEVLGREAIHIGDARLIAAGAETSRLTILSSSQEVAPGDRLRAVDEVLGLPYYYPRSPEQPVRGLIIAVPGGVAETGPLSVVVLNVGERDGIGEGHVLRILSQGEVRRDPLSGNPLVTPAEAVGLLVVFRTFEKLSYGLITNSTRQVSSGDAVANPETS